MKKLFLFIAISLFILPAFAGNLKTIQYKNLGTNAKYSYNEELYRWTKDKSADDISELYTICDYVFLINSKMYGYSNNDLKFFELLYTDGKLQKRALEEMEVQKLFPNRKIIKITDFSEETNSIKIKKNSQNRKLIIYNNTDKTFENYSFSTGNSKFDKYILKGFIDIDKKGMIQFSCYGENSKERPWYIILVR